MITRGVMSWSIGVALLATLHAAPSAATVAAPDHAATHVATHARHAHARHLRHRSHRGAALAAHTTRATSAPTPARAPARPPHPRGGTLPAQTHVMRPAGGLRAASRSAIAAASVHLSPRADFVRPERVEIESAMRPELLVNAGRGPPRGPPFANSLRFDRPRRSLRPVHDFISIPIASATLDAPASTAARSWPTPQFRDVPKTERRLRRSHADRPEGAAARLLMPSLGGSP